MSVDTNESTEAVGQEVVCQEMVEPPSTDRHESSQGPLMRHGDISSPTGSEYLQSDDPEVVPQPEVHGRREVNSPTKEESRCYPTRERRKPDHYGWS